MSALRTIVTVGVLGTSLQAGIVQADPIAVTSGTVTVTVSGGVTGAADVAGNAFSFVGGTDGGNTQALCLPCAVGESAGFSTELVAPFLGVVASGGETFNLTPSGSLGALTFDGPAFVLPPTTSSTMSFSAPFTFSGFLGEDGGSGEPAFRVDLTGRGTATARYQVFADPQAGPLYTFERLDFNFESAAPIPEPASLTLLAGGLGVVARRVRRSRRQWARAYGSSAELNCGSR